MTATQFIWAAPFLTIGTALSFLGMVRRQLTMQSLLIYWALFATGVISYSVLYAADDRLGPMYGVFAFACSGSCGLAWLLARALFRPAGARGQWPIAVVATLFLTGLIIDLADGWASSFAIHILSNIYILTSSTVLLLTLVEPLEGYRTALPPSEKQFRRRFIAGYGALLVCAIILQQNAGSGELTILHPVVIKVTCAVFALLGASAAVRYRLNHPQPAAPARPARPRVSTPADELLAGKIRALLDGQQLFTDPEIKVADLAHHLGEPDYKVTQSITGSMGFQNFNRLMNHYRLEQAKKMLADPAYAKLPILTIALDCGFGSVGPFNRAFKEMTGTTPGAWRTAQLTA